MEKEEITIGNLAKVSLQGKLIRYYFIANKINEEEIKEILDAGRNLRNKIEGNYVLIVNVGSLSGMSIEARKLSEEEQRKYPPDKLAMVIHNPVQRVMSAFFTKLHPFDFPYKFFDREEDAIKWLQD